MLTFLTVYFVTSCAVGLFLGPVIKVGMSRPGCSEDGTIRMPKWAPVQVAQARFRTRDIEHSLQS
jgi:hypothetical protein